MLPNLDRLRALMAEKEVPALLVTDPTDVGWLTGFTGSFGYVIVTPSDARFITDSRYTIQAREQVPDLPLASFSSPTDGPSSAARSRFPVARIKAVDGYDPSAFIDSLFPDRTSSGYVLVIPPFSADSSCLSRLWAVMCTESSAKLPMAWSPVAFAHRFDCLPPEPVAAC